MADAPTTALSPAVDASLSTGGAMETGTLAASEAGIDTAMAAGTTAAYADTAAVLTDVGAEMGAEVMGEEGMAMMGAEAAGTGAEEGAVAVLATVMCSELARQGKIDMELLELESRYTRSHLTIGEYIGYLSFGEPLARLMSRSKIFTFIVSPAIKSYAREMAHREEDCIRGSKIGSVMYYIGRKICKFAYGIIQKKYSINSPSDTLIKDSMIPIVIIKSKLDRVGVGDGYFNMLHGLGYWDGESKEVHITNLLDMKDRLNKDIGLMIPYVNKMVQGHFDKKDVKNFILGMRMRHMIDRLKKSNRKDKFFALYQSMKEGYING
jgi:hypothetical protein